MTGVPAAPRWGIQTGLFQRRQPAFWLFVILLAYAGIQVIDTQLLMLDRVPTQWAVSWALMLVYAVPVAFAIYKLDLFEREPLTLIAAALLWGGVVAIAFAGVTNDAGREIVAKLGVPRSWSGALVAPPVEETLKVMGVIAIVLIARAEIDDVFDGFVYGAMIGLGFTVLEDVQYFILFAIEAGRAAGAAAGDIGPVLHGFFIRVIASGLYGHVLYTGVAGMGVAYFATHREQAFSRRLGVALAAFAISVAAHFLWNSPLLRSVILGTGNASHVQWILYGAIKGLPFLIFVGLLVRLATRREKTSFATLVASGAGDTVATATEIEALGSLRSRRAARKKAGLEFGPQAETLVGKLQREQVGYALARSRVDRADDPEVLGHVAAIGAIRAELAALPRVQPVVAAAAAASNAGAAPVAPAAAAPWQPSHVVPAGGMAAWAAADPAQAPVVSLAERLELAVDERAGDWARVRAVNGWTGWVDARLLVARPEA